MSREGPSRRAFLAAALLAPGFLYLTRARAASRAAPTPACGDGQATPPQTEGPFFKPRSPERRSLVEPGVEGAPIAVEGRVVSTGCKPVAGALVDFWQADARGAYDNAGYRLRGHQFTDGAGRYRLETIVPGLYPGRARHFHVRVQAPDRPALTTQLYFPGEPGNRRDGIFNPRLLLVLGGAERAKTGRFDFVLDLA